ncbi:MAG TPA: metallophosphoesterase [Pyrinomonadaceae bacterium]|nr:metallophosphoesterase [Pyrinomonadaceae bacterium]
MSNLSSLTLQNQIATKRTRIEVRLETDPRSFRRIEPQFVADLASALGTDPEQIRKIKIVEGCVRFFFDLPTDVAEKFKQALRQKPLPAELQQLFDAYNIDPRDTKFDVVEEAPYVKRWLTLSDQLRKDGRVLTWLHLSDVHFQNAVGAMRWTQDKVKESFLSQLPKLLAEWELSPDLLFFTGDIAYSGEIEQYQIANDFLKQIESRLSKQIRTYVVPGNHDVAWSKIDNDKRLRKTLSDQYEVSDFFVNTANEPDRKKTFARFDDFWKFLDDKLPKPPIFKNDYFYVDQFEHSGVKLGVAGLNSAWLSTKKRSRTYDVDLGELVLGEPQIFKSVQLLESADIKFALLHHPPESMWFKDFDRRMQRALLPKFDFILRGHEHEPTTETTINVLTDDEYMHFASGALYDTSELKGRLGYPISFNCVRINLDTGEGVIFYWRYFSDLYKWKRDVIVDDGYKEFTIPPRVLQRLEAKKVPDESRPKGAGLPIPPYKKKPRRPSDE